MTLNYYIHKLGNAVSHAASGLLGLAALQNFGEGRYGAAIANATFAGMIEGFTYVRKQDYQLQQRSRQFAEDFERQVGELEQSFEKQTQEPNPVEIRINPNAGLSLDYLCGRSDQAAEFCDKALESLDRAIERLGKMMTRKRGNEGLIKPSHYFGGSNAKYCIPTTLEQLLIKPERYKG